MWAKSMISRGGNRANWRQACGGTTARRHKRACVAIQAGSQPATSGHEDRPAPH